MDWITDHWRTTAASLIGALGALAKFRPWRWVVSQTRTQQRVESLQQQVTERTKERDEAIKARNDAFQTAEQYRTMLIELQAASAEVLNRSRLMTSPNLPNPLGPSPSDSGKSPSGSPALPATKVLHS